MRVNRRQLIRFPCLSLLCLYLVTSIASQAHKALYYGFFFNADVAVSIKTLTDSQFRTCMESIPQFNAFITSLSQELGVDPYDYFIKPLDPNTQLPDPYYHITTKFCGNTDCSQYENNVTEYIDQPFSIQLIGYVFTNRTYGIRVKLTPEQLLLFDNYGLKMGTSDNISPDMTWEKQFQLPYIEFETQPEDFHPTDYRAHVTIGCALNVTAEVTGSDLQDVIMFEKDYNNTQVEIFEVNNEFSGKVFVVQYGLANEAYYVMYPEMKAIGPTTFGIYHQLPDNNGGKSTFQKEPLLLGIVLLIALGLYFRGSSKV